MQRELGEIRSAGLAAIAAAGDPAALEVTERKFLGRNGPLAKLLKGLPALPVEERRAVGPVANAVKQKLTAAVAERRAQLARRIHLDPTLPALPSPLGHHHPLSLALRDIEDTFVRMGFEVVDSPEVEEEEFNFDLLNVPKNHPARDLHDTFWLTVPGLLLRTHTSPMQIRAARSRKPPIRLIVPGRVFRHEATDAGHEAQFFHCEGLVVGEGIRVTDLIGTLQDFVSAFFGRKLAVRLRPHYYPFVEPGFDVDITCTICNGKGCAVCKRTGWLETLGSGMVHPTVLRNMRIDPARYTGFAFGLGVDRLLVLRSGMPDVRLSYAGDPRVSEQF